MTNPARNPKAGRLMIRVLRTLEVTGPHYRRVLAHGITAAGDTTSNAYRAIRTCRERGLIDAADDTGNPYLHITEEGRKYLAAYLPE